MSTHGRRGLGTSRGRESASWAGCTGLRAEDPLILRLLDGVRQCPGFPDEGIGAFPRGDPIGEECCWRETHGVFRGGSDFHGASAIPRASSACSIQASFSMKATNCHDPTGRAPCRGQLSAPNCPASDCQPQGGPNRLVCRSLERHVSDCGGVAAVVIPCAGCPRRQPGTSSTCCRFGRERR